MSKIEKWKTEIWNRRKQIAKVSLISAIVGVFALDVWLGTCGFQGCPSPREIQAYQLVRVSDARLGKGLRPSTVDCLAIQRAGDEAAKGGPPAPNPNTPERLVCGMRISVGRIQFGGRPMTMLTDALTAITQRRVVDRTGLTGFWEFDISFNPPAPPPGREAPPPDPNTASLFTVLQEQLGLKLESARLPMPVMVVDRVEPPVED